MNDRKLDIHATLHNGASKEIAVYIGHPTGQWVLATHQALALSVTDNSEISYWLSSIEGIITQAEQAYQHMSEALEGEVKERD